MPVDQFAFGGIWTIASEYAQATKGATLTEHFQATKVYLILNPVKGVTNKVDVTFNGKPLVGKFAGSDVVNGVITPDSDRLYNIFDSGNTQTDGTLKFTFENTGTQAFTFTFG